MSLKKFLSKSKNRLYKIITLRIIFPRVYKKYSKQPIDERKVVFIEVRLPEMTNSFKVLYDKLMQEYDYDVHTHFLRNTFVGKIEYMKRCNDMLKDIATAKYVFVNEASNVVSCIKPRKETVITQLWHACGAFKRFGFGTAELKFGETRKEMLKYPYYRNYTYLTLSSPEIVWAYEESMNLKGTNTQIVPIGTSRTDVFFDDEFIKKAYDKLRTLMPNSEGKKVILYAPTFRGRVANGKTPPMLREDLFKKELGDEYVLLVKHHPLVRRPPEIAETCKDFAQDFSDAMSIEELLCVSDICISDYSSLVFEFSLFEKPMIFYSFDLDDYFDWRGFYYDYYELAPGPILSTNLEMIDYIKHIDERFDKQKVIDFKNKFMSSCDGKVTERLIDLVFNESKDKYRLEQPNQGSFWHLPNATTMYREKLKGIKELKEMSDKLPKQYSRLVKNTRVKDKKVVLYGKQKEQFLMIKNALKELGAEIVELYGNKNDNDEILKQIVDAKYIVLYEEMDIINVLEIREETTVVQMWNRELPLKKFGYSSLAVKEGYTKEYLKVAPLHRNYKIVPVASDKVAKIYQDAFNISDTSVFKNIGNGSVDILFDKKFKEKAYKKLEKLFPKIKDKKIIVYLPENRLTVYRPRKPLMIDYSSFHEYLKDEYVIIYDYVFDKESNMSNELEGYMHFMYNAHGKMTVNELMSIADVLITDYRTETYTFAALRKPIFMYAPDRDYYYGDRETYYKYDEMVPGMILDNEEIIEILNNEKEYDYSTLDNFVNTYLGECDGKATKRLAELMMK